MVKQKGQAVQITEAPVDWASLVLNWLMRVPRCSSMNILAPPAPQQKLFLWCPAHFHKLRSRDSFDDVPRLFVNLIVPAEKTGVMIGNLRFELIDQLDLAGLDNVVDDLGVMIRLRNPPLGDCPPHRHPVSRISCILS